MLNSLTNGLRGRGPRRPKKGRIFTSLVLVLSALALSVTIAGHSRSAFAAPAEIPPGGCVCAGLTVPTPGGSIYASNLSKFPNERVCLLIQVADMGTITTNPNGDLGDRTGQHNCETSTTANGKMHPGATGDRVIVTNYGIYWIDLIGRSGDIGGMWQLALDGTGNINFANVANSNGFAPNALLPYSNGNGSADTDAGFNLRIAGTGGIDSGTCQPSSGKCVLGIQGSSDQSSFTSGISGNDDWFQVSGTMAGYIIDNENYQGTISFVLKYTFHNANDANVDDNGTLQAFRFNTNVTITEHNTYPQFGQHHLQISYVGMGDDMQRLSGLPAGVPLKGWTIASQATHHYNGDVQPCGQTNLNIPANTWVALCIASSMTTNFIQEATTLPTTLDQNGAVDHTDFCDTTTSCLWGISYIHPQGAFTQPARDSYVWNQPDGVTASETQYVSTADPYETWNDGSSQTYSLDQEFTQY